MVQIKREYFHYNSLEKNRNQTMLEVGQTIETGSELNPFMSDYEKMNVPITSDLNNLLQVITFYWHYTRERVLEDVRVELYPELPSRMRSLWLCDKENLDYWYNHFSNREYRVLKMVLEGNLSKHDATHIEGNPRSLIKLREDAKRYWSGEIIDSNKTEYLFEGKAKVVEIL